jgi:hypothetical protein
MPSTPTIALSYRCVLLLLLQEQVRFETKSVSELNSGNYSHSHIYNYHYVEHIDPSTIGDEWAGHDYTTLPTFDDFDFFGGQGSSS